MLTVHNFSYGLTTPLLGFVMSFIGSFLGLRCTTRARASTGRSRFGWLLVAAVSIGVTGIWVMHFIAMLGFTIPGDTITYNIPITLASMLIAVVFVAVGLLFLGFRQVSTRALLAAGVVTGLGVAAMHYVGMAAMIAPMRMTYNPGLFALSVVVAVVAATAALWSAIRLRTVRATAGAAAIMGVAVSSMHYLGMAAMHSYPAPAMGGAGGGASAFDFVLPLLIGVSLLTVVLTVTIALAPTDAELTAEHELMARIKQVRDGQPVLPQ
jgi:NO-binding membrane sensor protein with MHYT domain